MTLPAIRTRSANALPATRIVTANALPATRIVSANTLPAVRIVSLVPSVTETLAAWGVDPIACTRFCERPDLEHVGGTKNPDIEAITELRPDLVVVDREENRSEDYDALVANGTDVQALHVASLDDVEPELGQLAARIGVEWSTEPLPEQCKPLEHPSGRNVRVFVPIWRRPYMTIGARTYGASLLAWCGVDVAFADRGRYPTIDAGDLSAGHFDIVLAPTEPYPCHLRHLDELAKIAPTHVIDGQDLFWWGTRTPGAVVRVAETVRRALRQQGPPQTARSSVTVQ
ncbi:helical backbone metal receptor [Candidatus Poriferisodalis sp.]|uniref:helical backbone metal receptor n=1 Tax=Candidatus Poriferisodalis sp. TaxID=3101277 RepID=UPI003C6FB066